MLDKFFSSNADGFVQISAEQGSAFAKQIAGDFNVIHDADSKRFCVPGDLLFALALKHYGVFQKMNFAFKDLVGADVGLSYPEKANQDQIDVSNQSGKVVLSMQTSGDNVKQPHKIEQLLKNYVAFSGQNFPHILVPLMEQHGVMINPARPLVIYQSMSLEFDHLEFDELQVELESTHLDLLGKRANADLNFELLSEGERIGLGKKRLVLSGLREFERDAIQQLVDSYLASRDNYQGIGK